MSRPRSPHGTTLDPVALAASLARRLTPRLDALAAAPDALRALQRCAAEGSAHVDHGPLSGDAAVQLAAAQVCLAAGVRAPGDLDRDDPVAQVVDAALGRLGLDAGQGVTVRQLAALAGCSYRRASREGPTPGKGGRVSEASARGWLADQASEGE